MANGPNTHYHHYHEPLDAPARDTGMWAVALVILAVVLLLLFGSRFFARENTGSTNINVPSPNVNIPGDSSGGTSGANP
ncbi:MAG TPA: hypothetical protein VD998_00030 [Verrucomicrobiae bacterium]|nr:hypothetical protein [Verrucomicrobiae bacterium]